MKTPGLRIIVLGFIVRGPLGGMAWSNLEYLRALRRLGHDVFFAEDSGDYPGCVDPSTNLTDTDPSYGLKFAAQALSGIGFGDRWVYHDAHTGRWLGPCANSIELICRSADVVLNLCGVNPLRSWLAAVPVRILVDEDPVFTQVRHLTDPPALAAAREHNAFFTFAENFGQCGCRVPQDGLPWRPTRQPVVLQDRAVAPGVPEGTFTTVMLWQSYEPCEYQGVRYGLKAASFPRYMDLPQRVEGPFELAMGGADVPTEELTRMGWRLRNGTEITLDVPTYESYIRNSKGEFSVAKHGYTVSRSGWFSERSVMYLATGRPVILEDTGFSAWMKTGEGILPFTNADEAAAAVENVHSQYERHCRKARQAAEEYFDSRQVLTRLLDEAREAAASQ